MILMPIYRYNTAGIQICDDDTDKLTMPCNSFLPVICIVIVVWVASCCTSFAFNKNDYSKEFGYSTRAVQENVDNVDEASDNDASPKNLTRRVQGEDAGVPFLPGHGDRNIGEYDMSNNRRGQLQQIEAEQ